MAETLGLDEDDPTMQTLEDLPEIDGQPIEAELPAPEAAADEPGGGDDMFSAKDLLGGEDFDLPPPPSGGAQQMVAKPPSGFTPPPPAAPKAATPSSPLMSNPPASPAAVPNLLGGVPAPSFGAFKNPAPAFKPPSPFGSTAPPPAPLPGADKTDPSFSLRDVGHAAHWAEVRQALTSAEAPAKVPGDLGMLAVHLCRALVRKGVISVDELLAEVDPH